MTSAEKLEQRFSSFPFIVSPTGEQLDDLFDLPNHPGFAVLWGLLCAERQGQFHLLESAPLGSPELDSRASVTQGVIRGLARPAQLMVELMQSNDTTPAEDTSND